MSDDYELFAGEEREIAGERTREVLDITKRQNARFRINGENRDRVVTTVGSHQNLSVGRRFDRSRLRRKRESVRSPPIEAFRQQTPLADFAERAPLSVFQNGIGDDGAVEFVQNIEKTSVL